MSKTIELAAHTYYENKEAEPKNSMFLCGETLAGIWDHEFPHGSTWTVCLRKRTPKGHRPYKEAIKLNIPKRVAKGVQHEQSDGTMSDDKLLVHDTDDILRRKRLTNAEYWCWVEVDA